MKILKYIYNKINGIGRSIMGLRFYDIFQFPQDKKSEIRISYKNFQHQAEEYKKRNLPTLHFSDNLKGKNIGFVLFSTGTPKEVRMMIFWADLLKKRYRTGVKWIVCSGQPKYCENHSYRYKGVLGCRACYLTMEQVLKLFDQEYVFLKELKINVKIPGKLEECLEFQYDGVSVGEIAKYSNFKNRRRDIVSSSWLNSIQNAIYAYIHTYESMKYTAKENGFDLLLTMGGQYSNYRAVVNAAKNIGISYITYENFGPNKIILAKDNICFNMPVEQITKEIDDEKYREKAIKTLESIKSGKYYNRRYNKEIDLNDIRDLEDSYILLCPNVSWDSAVYYKGSIFYKNQLEWILDTIEFCKEQKIPLIVRCHPGGKKMGGTFTLYEQLNKLLDEIPAKVKIYSHDSDVSTYSLMQKASKGLVYVSTIGMEFPHCDVPVIVVGEAYYKYRGFSFDPKTRNEYYSLIRQNLEVSEEQKENLYKYVYKLSEYRIDMSYGEFFKFTGGDKITRRNLTESEYEKHVDDNFDYEKFDRFIRNNF